MQYFPQAFWAELLKFRRSKVPVLTTAGFSILPIIAGLFMVILKNPEQARTMGLISTKARLSAGTADWPTLFSMLTQGLAIGGAMLFAMMTSWVFGREFSDRTLKDLLALPTPRGSIVAAKFGIIMLWIIALALLIFLLGLVVGVVVDIPGRSVELAWKTGLVIVSVALLSFLLIPWVALFASIGRGYLPPLGWAFLTMVLAQIAAALGWGDWFPWSVPALLSGLAGPHAQQPDLHSYLGLAMVFGVGLSATWLWWRDADHTT